MKKPTIKRKNGKTGGLDKFLRQILAGVSVTAVLAIIVGLFLLLLATFGSCETAASIAALAPEKIEWRGVTYTHDQIAHAIMSLRREGCHAVVTAEIFRFCNDRKLGGYSLNGGYRVNEEAFLLNVRLRSFGLQVNKLTLHLNPGVISGTPGEDGPYQEIMDDQSDGFQRERNLSAANIGRCR